LSNLSLYWHTVRHLSCKQLAYRGKAMARRRWRAIRRQRAPQGPARISVHIPLLYEVARSLAIPDHLKPLAAAAIQRARGIGEGRFSFLNQEVHYPNGVDWNDPWVSQLWRYHLHYFGYVEALILLSVNGEEEKAWRTFKTLSSAWISGNTFLRGDGWHPYTVSLRVVNWLNAFVYWQPYFDEEAGFRRLYVSSLYGQARFLAANLEQDVRGNHLLENLRALLWAGTAFVGKEASGWERKALSLLEKELAEQVLPDGGHFERAPGYHGTVLKDCLEMALWLKRNGRSVPAWLDETLLRMLRYLMSLLPPDGQYPLLKDTAWDAVPSPVDLLSAGALYFNRGEFKIAESLGWYPWFLFGRSGEEAFQPLHLPSETKASRPLSDSGFLVLKQEQKKDYLILDVGKPCPEYLPAHAHADMLSYELMVGGRRVVVDSGVYEYRAGKWRDFFRSTRAHNTVEIDGKNQSEVWGSFRVARRAEPGHVHYTESGNRVVMDARHDGYVRQGIQAVHRRVVWWEKDRFWFVFDEIYGKDRVRAKSFVHLHPGLVFESTDLGSFQIHEGPRPVLGMKSFGTDVYEIMAGREKGEVQGWYSEEFGRKVPNPVLSLEKEGELPFCFGYVLYEGRDISMEFSQMGSRTYAIDILLQGKMTSIHIEPGKATYCS
jgi:uncharacterized heparinase superfamily protein